MQAIIQKEMQQTHMFRFIGLVILLIVLSKMFAASFVAADRAAVAGFNTLELAAILAQEQMQTNR